MGSISDDAVNSMMNLLLKLLEMLKNIERGGTGGNMKRTDKNKSEKTPKIKFGEMKGKEYKKLLQSGQSFEILTNVDASQLSKLNELAKKYGAKYFVIENDGSNTATIAVPTQYLKQMTSVMESAVKSQTEQGAAETDTSNILSAEKMETLNAALRQGDIPVYTFKTTDGNYMNVVPKEYKGQYDAALKQTEEISESLENVEITRFSQTKPLGKIDYVAEKVSAREAAYLQNGNSNVKLTKTDEGITAVYPKRISADVDRLKNEYKNNTEEAEKYLITVVDRYITLNVEALKEREDEKSYLMRVPNTSGKDYIRIDKSEAQLIDGGKTIQLKLDFEKTYPIYEKDGSLKSERSGAKLSESFNTKTRTGNKDTEVFHYYNDRVERVEFYNAADNRLISIGIESAEKMAAALKERGVSEKAAEELINQLNERLPAEYKEAFSYSDKTPQPKFTSNSKVDELLKQSELARAVEGAACLADNSKGESCCIYDKNKDSYAVLPILPRAEIANKLIEMGYDGLEADAIAAKAVGEYLDSDIAKINAEKSAAAEINGFTSKNPELRNIGYAVTSNSVIVAKAIGDNCRYMEIDENTPRSQIEHALKKKFEITDEMSVCEIMKELDEKNLIAEPATISAGDYTVSKTTENYLTISDGQLSVTVCKNSIDGEKLANGLGLTMEAVDKLKSSLNKSLQQEEKSGNKAIKTLNELKRAASEQIEKLKGKKENSNDKELGFNSVGTNSNDIGEI